MNCACPFQFPEKIYMGITEANLVDYAGMSLIKHNGLLSNQLNPITWSTSYQVRQ